MGSIVLQLTRTDGLLDRAKDTDRSLDAAEGTDGLSGAVKEMDKLLGAAEEIEAVGRLEDCCAEGRDLLNWRGRRNDIVHDSRKKIRTDVTVGILN